MVRMHMENSSDVFSIGFLTRGELLRSNRLTSDRAVGRVSKKVRAVMARDSWVASRMRNCSPELSFLEFLITSPTTRSLSSAIARIKRHRYLRSASFKVLVWPKSSSPRRPSGSSRMLPGWGSVWKVPSTSIMWPQARKRVLKTPSHSLVPPPGRGLAGTCSAAAAAGHAGADPSGAGASSSESVSPPSLVITSNFSPVASSTGAGNAILSERLASSNTFANRFSFSASTRKSNSSPSTSRYAFAMVGRSIPPSIPTALSSTAVLRMFRTSLSMRLLAQICTFTATSRLSLSTPKCT
mmetsp:Transcript_23092/g.43950  ORF Transcript_23092/g.43950 Transcript_23092/m.43950 type:complete len:297 (-) Transcript_23092:808-1698(-)